MGAIKIAVDAGHGSNTPGKRTPPMPKNIDFEADGVIDVKKGEAIREHQANVGVAYYTAYYLKKYGFQVVKTGWNDKNSKDDEDTPLSKRQATIKAAGCLLSVSCHFNAAGDGKSFHSGQGVETYMYQKARDRGQSEQLAKKIQARLIRGTKQKDRGVRSADLAMCNTRLLGTEASVLCEYAFMTNLEEAYLMGSRDFWKECGHETALGIWDYLSKKPKDTIKQGNATRSQVIWLQVKLRLAGEDVVATGVWDTQTVKAVKSFWMRQTGKNCTGKKVSINCIKLLA